ncbi:hypothetical protein VP01_637g5 [Puccinia sorghi]|uniref:Uncharacterized protein n=1 Tax=Puccinia sorghi TaxID=27349 RepID=A0A0L6UGT0_9BASI|nr:hypothetical protein VP01_637g5 [Puccinia sorghi]
MVGFLYLSSVIKAFHFHLVSGSRLFIFILFQDQGCFFIFILFQDQGFSFLSCFRIKVVHFFYLVSGSRRKRRKEKGKERGYSFHEDCGVDAGAKHGGGPVEFLDYFSAVVGGDGAGTPEYVNQFRLVLLKEREGLRLREAEFKFVVWNHALVWGFQERGFDVAGAKRRGAERVNPDGRRGWNIDGRWWRWRGSNFRPETCILKNGQKRHCLYKVKYIYFLFFCYFWKLLGVLGRQLPQSRMEWTTPKFDAGYAPNIIHNDSIKHQRFNNYFIHNHKVSGIFMKWQYFLVVGRIFTIIVTFHVVPFYDGFDHAKQPHVNIATMMVASTHLIFGLGLARGFPTGGLSPVPAPLYIPQLAIYILNPDHYTHHSSISPHYRLRHFFFPQRLISNYLRLHTQPPIIIDCEIIKHKIFSNLFLHYHQFSGIEAERCTLSHQINCKVFVLRTWTQFLVVIHTGKFDHSKQPLVNIDTMMVASIHLNLWGGRVSRHIKLI